MLTLLCKIKFWVVFVFCSPQGQEVQFNKRMSLATEELQFPAISGFPVQLAVNASAAINIKIKGNADFKQQSNFFLNGYIKPRY